MKPWSFRHDFFDSLPGLEGPPQPSRATPGILWMGVKPSPVSRPSWLIGSTETAALLDLTEADLQQELWIQGLSGNQLLAGSVPLATRYGGHQFGHWAGQLGDGRALLLGEYHNHRGEIWEVQLKGAGQTPYSRGADGRAVLRSSLREFLCSEAMHHLGVPTTRALSCVLTGDSVIRDMLYDGNPEPEPGAITARVAPSFLRLGHFQILAAQGETELLRSLTIRVLERFHPEFLTQSSTDTEGGQTARLSEEGISRWFNEVCRRTAQLMAHWTRVHFVHGVMNTDNLSILGLTIDYGPYGWLDTFDPDWTPNTTDANQRRYRFGNQPSIALWNLARFAESLLPLFDSEDTGKKALEVGLASYRTEFQRTYLSFAQRKLGLSTSSPSEVIPLLERLDELLRTAETDPTIFYRSLARIHEDSLSREAQVALGLEVVREALMLPEQLTGSLLQGWQKWLTQYLELSATDRRLGSDKKVEMDQNNPVFILRNYLVQEALDALAQQDRKPLDSLMNALRDPYRATSATLPYFKKRPEWARTRVGCAALSCSS